MKLAFNAVTALLATSALATSASATTSAPYVCTSGYYDGHYYEVYEGTMTWLDTRSYVDYLSHCSVTGYLVSINSSGENDFITGLLEGGTCSIGTYTFIGLTDEAEEDMFYWEDGSPLDGSAFTNWCGDPIEPNDAAGGEDYVHIHLARAAGGCWNDIPDTVGGDFIVEYDCGGGDTMGDPHFKTWNGEWYDFMGACDLHLLQAPKFDPELDLTIDIRTKIRYEYSYIESAVVKIGDETLEVSSFGQYSLNGVGNAKLPGTVSGYSVTHTQTSSKSHLFEIEIADKEFIRIKTFKDLVAVEVHDTNPERFQGSRGMMGNYETGYVTTRDGKTKLEDPIAMAEEWQVRADEPSLFESAQGPQHPEKCVMPIIAPTQEKRRRLGETVARSSAEKVCSKYTNSKPALEACVYDVMATGDLDMAEAGAF